MRNHTWLCLFVVCGCGKDANKQRLESSLLAERAWDAAKATAKQHVADCLSGAAQSLARLPAETWAPSADVRPADRAALASASAVSYVPLTHKLDPYAPDWMIKRKLAAGAACQLAIPDMPLDEHNKMYDPDTMLAKAKELESQRPQASAGDVLAVSTSRCEDLETGKRYVGATSSLEVKGSTCADSVLWVRASTGQVLAKISVEAAAGPGATPGRASATTAGEIAHAAQSKVYYAIQDKLEHATDKW